MTHTKSISIITPSFNQGKYIARTIESVISQNKYLKEYIVFDGGSTDNTLSVLADHQENLQWYSEPDDGQSHAVNKGLKMASGDIIGWLNSDDIYYPGTLDFVAQFFDDNPDIDVIYGDAYHIDENNELISLYPTEEWNLKNLLKFCYISQPAVFFRRNIIEKMGLLDEKLMYCMDYEYWLRLGLSGIKFAYVAKTFAGSRLYPGTKTTVDPRKNYFEAITMLRQKLGYVPTHWLIKYIVKTKIPFRYPGERINIFNVRQNFLMLILICREVLRWNGIKKGLYGCLFLPKAFIDLFHQQKKVASLVIQKNQKKNLAFR